METAKIGKSTCRNEVIAEAFHYMHIIEAWGTGIPRIINRCKEYGLAEPLFEEFGNGFKVTIFRKVSNDSQKVSNAFEKYVPLLIDAGITEKFIENIEKVFTASNIGVPFGQANIMEWLNCSKSKATNIMNAMKAAKVIKKVTGVRAGRYEFIEL